jgi:hypothetical protein
MSHRIKEVIYNEREEWREVPTGEVEADDIHAKGDQQGREVSAGPGNGRMARTRGLSRRGRGTYATDKPLVVSWIERGGSGARLFELHRSAGKKSLLASALTRM